MKSFAITIKWTSIAGVLISDGKTDIGFDLTFTRPQLKHWLFNEQFLPNDELLEEKVKEFQIKKLDAQFISHTHFDHAVDVPWFSAKFHAPIYGTTSIQRLSKAYESITNRPVFLTDMVDHTPIILGEFKVTPFLRPHAAIIQWIDWHFAEGMVSENNQLNFYDYRVGDTWCYLIEHPSGNIYLDQGGQPIESIMNTLPKVDVAILGVANRKSTEDWINGYAKKMMPKMIMPLHYDWFLLSWPKIPFTMPGMQLDETEVELSKLGIKLQRDIIALPLSQIK